MATNTNDVVRMSEETMTCVLLGLGSDTAESSPNLPGVKTVVAFSNA